MEANGANYSNILALYCKNSVYEHFEVYFMT